MISRTRRLAATAALAISVGLGLAPAALAAGQYDYVLQNVPNDAFYSRGVYHDYSYLRGTIGLPGTTTCVARGGGSSFCASGSANHSYSDSCNSCLSYYKQKAGFPIDITVHDEWR